jgi:hypothetical protein
MSKNEILKLKVGTISLDHKIPSEKFEKKNEKIIS